MLRYVLRNTQKVDFTSRYMSIATIVNEFEAFLMLPQENFNKCNPIKWWAVQVSQFQSLSLLVKDILSIPGTVIILCIKFYQLTLA